MPQTVRESTDDHDGDGEIPLVGGSTTRRGLLTAAAAMVGSSLYAGGHVEENDSHLVSSNNAVAGGPYKVAEHVLDLDGTLRELFVGVRHDHFPAVSQTPSLRIVLDGPWLIDTGGVSNPDPTGWIRTNVASIDVAQAWLNVGGTDIPALKVSQTGSPAISVVLDGQGSTRSAVGGSIERFNAAPTTADLPSNPAEPAIQVAASGDFEVWA